MVILGVGYGHFVKMVGCGLTWSILFHAVHRGLTGPRYGGFKQIILDATLFTIVYGLLQLAADYVYQAYLNPIPYK